MAIAIISDIHGDIDSLREAISIIKARGVAKVICLGDLFSEEADNDAILEILLELDCTFILGNHDLEVERTPLMDHYMDIALESLSLGNFHFTHYIERRYVLPITESWQAWNIFDEFRWSYMFIGHNHIAGLFVHNPHVMGESIHLEGSGTYNINQQSRCIVSVGSITPGRDYHGHRSFVIYEDKTNAVEFITF